MRYVLFLTMLIFIACGGIDENGESAILGDVEEERLLTPQEMEWYDLMLECLGREYPDIMDCEPDYPYIFIAEIKECGGLSDVRGCTFDRGLSIAVISTAPTVTYIHEFTHSILRQCRGDGDSKHTAWFWNEQREFFVNKCGIRKQGEL